MWRIFSMPFPVSSIYQSGIYLDFCFLFLRKAKIIIDFHHIFPVVISKLPKSPPALNLEIMISCTLWRLRLPKLKISCSSEMEAWKPIMNEISWFLDLGQKDFLVYITNFLYMVFKFLRKAKNIIIALIWSVLISVSNFQLYQNLRSRFSYFLKERKWWFCVYTNQHWFLSIIFSNIYATEILSIRSKSKNYNYWAALIKFFWNYEDSHKNNLGY